MSDLERATVISSSSSSQLETVQPFSIEETSGLPLGCESPRQAMMDSSTLMCTSIGRSPVMSGAFVLSDQSYDPYLRMKSCTNCNQVSNDKTNSHGRTAFTTSIGDDSSSSSTSSSGDSVGSDNENTNQSARSSSTDDQDAELGNSLSTSNRPSDGMPTEESTAQHSSPNDGPAEYVVSPDHSRSDSILSNESHGDDGLNVFANLTDGASGAEHDRPATLRHSQRPSGKHEIANLIEKAILDFCSSRTVETMRRMFAGVANETDALQRDGGRYDDKLATTPHPVTGELVKEGVIIGDIDVFAPRVQREFIVPMQDVLVEAFLKEPGVFRAICYRTRCQVEITKRLLNRKLSIGGRWHKYIIMRIIGPTLKSILNCDTLLQKAVPSYKCRKEYNMPAPCRVYLREEMPDNTELYYGYQRTGGAAQRFGSLHLGSPYRSTPTRNVSTCPWKLDLLRVGKVALSGDGVALCMKHVYPSMGFNSTSCLEREYQGVSASERVGALHDQFQVRRQEALTLKRNLTVPVCR